jgi:hypothetical protein
MSSNSDPQREQPETYPPKIFSSRNPKPPRVKEADYPKMALYEQKLNITLGSLTRASYLFIQKENYRLEHAGMTD